MSLILKIIIMSLALLIIVVFGFGWHIKTVYNGFVASTDTGDALFERAVLEAYADQILDDLKDKDVRVAIVSRSGQERSKLPKGVMFTHSAFFVREGSANAPRYDVYNLYHGEDNRLVSSLVTDTPADFLRLLKEPDAGIIIPTHETQDQLYAHIHSDQYAAVHQKNYSLISNPFDLRWQNCNEFMLYTMGAMIWQSVQTQEIEAALKRTISPTILKVSYLRRHLGPKIDERLILDDQGKTIQTTTFKTLAELLRTQERLQSQYVLNLVTP